MPVCRRVGLAQQFFLNLLEVARHERAKRRKWAARKDERDGQRLAAKLAQAHGLAQLIREAIIRYRIADVQWFDISHRAEWPAGGQSVGDRGRVEFLDSINPAVRVRH